jgi:hypothetical protein
MSHLSYLNSSFLVFFYKIKILAVKLGNVLMTYQWHFSIMGMRDYKLDLKWLFKSVSALYRVCKDDYLIHPH